MCSITTNLISTYFNYCPKNTFNVKLKLPDRAAFKFWISLHKAAIKGRGPGISPDCIERDPGYFVGKQKKKKTKRNLLAVWFPPYLLY